jgi:hypothetical protein
MGDAYAEHAPERLVNPAVAWGTLGAHVVTAKGDRGELEWGVVTVVSLAHRKFGSDSLSLALTIARECHQGTTRSRTALQGSAVAAAVAAVPFSVPVAAVVAAVAAVVCLRHQGPSSSRGSVA